MQCQQRRAAVIGLSVALASFGIIGCAVGDGSGDTNPITHDTGSGVDSRVDDSSGGHDTNVDDSGTKPDTSTGDTGSPDTTAVDTGVADTKDAGSDTADTADTTIVDSGKDVGPDTADTADSAIADTADAITPSDALSTCVNKGFDGPLVTFDFGALAGGEASATAKTVVSGITSGTLTRSTGTSGLTATAGSGSFNSSSWGVGSSADKGKYLTFTVTPASGCLVSLETLFVDVKSSGTGPTNGSVGTSVDTFTALGTPFAKDTTTTVTIGGVSGKSGAIEIRIYGYGATGSGGTMRVQNTMTLNGRLD